jgi:hypothetical protein
MLAALLLNLGSTPAPAPTPVRTGAPVWWRYCDEDDEECEREAEVLREAIPELAPVVERAVEAIRTVKYPDPIVFDAAQVYERAIEAIRSEVIDEIRDELRLARNERLERERIGELWRAELRRRVREQEDEDERMLIFALLT